MKYLFIDANIWLSLFHFTKDTFDKFEVLKRLLTDEIKLIIPDQIYSEVLRNRDEKVKSSWDHFCQFNLQIPAFCQGYSEYNDFLDSYRNLKRSHDEWKRKIEEDIQNHTLKADRLLAELFDTAGIHNCTPETIKLAEIRYKSGNPPGKNNSLGDAINWEFLLQFIPTGHDLFFISADHDYCSELDDKCFNFFLLNEWKTKKKANVFFFKTLYEFLQNHVDSTLLHEDQPNEPDNRKQEEKEQERKAIVELAKSIEDSSVGEEKNNAITLLQKSGSFASTHNAISLLTKYESWTQDQIDAICNAAITNDQIWRIIHDEDVDAFYNKILKINKSESQYVAKLRTLLDEKPDETFDNFIF